MGTGGRGVSVSVSDAYRRIAECGMQQEMRDQGDASPLLSPQRMDICTRR